MTAEEPSAEFIPAALSTDEASASSSAAPSLRTAEPNNRILGMTPPQLAVIVGLGAALMCILAVFAYIVFSAS